MDAALVAIQLEIGPVALSSSDAYRRTLEDAAARAADAARDAEARLFVFPECAGHLALAALAGAHARKATTLAGAFAAAALRRPLDVLHGFATTRRLDPRHAVLAALAPDGERWFRSVIAPLARAHRAWIVAGSHFRLAPGGELTNASHVFAPDGRLVATTDKCNLVPGIEDVLGLARGDADRVPIVDTELGRLATLIGYDAFRAPHSAEERFAAVAPRLAARGGVAIVANPAADPRQGTGDGDPRLPRWERDGTAAALAEVPYARFAVTAQLVGRLLDLDYAGTSEILEGTTRLARAERPDRGDCVAVIVDL